MPFKRIPVKFPKYKKHSDTSIKKVVDQEIKKKEGNYNFLLITSPAISANNTEAYVSLTGQIPLSTTTTSALQQRTGPNIEVLGYEIEAMLTQSTNTNAEIRFVVAQHETNTPSPTMANVSYPLSKMIDSTLVRVLTDKKFCVGASPSVRMIKIKRWFKNPIKVTYPSSNSEATQPILYRLVESATGGTFANVIQNSSMKLMYRS